MQKVQNQVNLIQSEVVLIGPQIATLQNILSSQIENIDINFTGTLVIDNTSVLVEVSLLGDTLCSKLEQLSQQTSQNDALILTAIDGIQCSVTDLGPVLLEISLSDAMLCSKLEQLSQQTSQNDALILTAIDGIQCSVTDLGPLLLEISIGDAMLCSKIGTLDALGTCLDALIAVPQDINNLQLTIIALLKTILLELRACGS